MYRILENKSFSFIITLIIILFIASCQKECKPRHNTNHQPYTLTELSTHLTAENKKINFKIKSNIDSVTNTLSNNNLVLRITRKKGKSAIIEGARQIQEGLFELPIKDSTLNKLNKDLSIQVKNNEKQAIFEFELVYNGVYLGNAQQVIWNNKHIQLSIKKLTTKLKGTNKKLNFAIHNKSKHVPEEGYIIVRFTRKAGYKAAITGPGIVNISEAHNKDSGIYELPILNGHLERKISDLSLGIEEGETSAVFEMQLVYKGTLIGKFKTITWEATKIDLSLKKVSHELRGEEKRILFSIEPKIKKGEVLTGNVCVRVTKILNTNAVIIGAAPIGQTSAFELPIRIEQIGLEKTINTLSIQVAEGDTHAQFKLQLVYNNIDIGEAKIVTWRATDIKLKLANVSKKLIGEGQGKILKFTIKNTGKHLPKKNKTILRINRVKNTHTKITPAIENGVGSFEIPVEYGATKQHTILTQEGDKTAEFILQLFYDGMEMGKSQKVIWHSNEPNLELKKVADKLIGEQNTQIGFTITNKNGVSPDPSKKLVLKLRRKNGYNATITGAKDIGNGEFNLEIDHRSIGTPIKKLQITHKPGEIKAAFMLQLVYDGIEMGKPVKVTWKAEEVQLEIASLTDKMRGNDKNIKFRVTNKRKNTPEVNELYINLTRIEGYNATINNAKDKGNGLFEFKIDTRYIGKEINDLVIEPRKGETKAKFSLQLVYKGINIGNPKQISWREEDVKLHINHLTNKLAGDNKEINFTINSTGKDRPDDKKLFIRFTCKKGYEAAIDIIKISPQTITSLGNGFFEFPLNGTEIDNPIKDFKVVTREGVKDAKFEVQLIYDGKEITKPQEINWQEKIVGIYLEDITNVLQGDGEKNTTIKFKIKRKIIPSQTTDYHALEPHKLAVRFIRANGSAIIKKKNSHFDNNTITSAKQAGIFEFPIEHTQIGNVLADFIIVPVDNEETAEFKLELVYDEKKIDTKDIKWTKAEVNPILKLKNSRLEGVEEHNRIIEFEIQKKEKDSLESEKLVLRIKRKADNKSILTYKEEQVSMKEDGLWELKLDKTELNISIRDLKIVPDKTRKECQFELQLIYDNLPLGKKQTVTWKNKVII